MLEKQRVENELRMRVNNRGDAAWRCFGGPDKLCLHQGLQERSHLMVILWYYDMRECQLGHRSLGTLLGKGLKWHWSLLKDQCGAISLCFASIYQSLLFDGCDSVLVQIKSCEIERDGTSRLGATKRDGMFGDGGGIEDVLLPQQKVTSPVMDGPRGIKSADLTRWALSPPSRPLCFISTALSRLPELLLIWFVQCEELRVHHCVHLCS